MDIKVDEKLAGMTVRELLQKRLGYSSNMIKKLKFSEGGILVDGHFVTVRHVLSIGEVLSLAVEDKDEDVSPYTIPVDIPIDVIFEDCHMTAVNKPPFMPSHPSMGHRDDTVSNALAYRYRDKSYVFRPTNRLDRDTSGCMLTANTKSASYKLYRAMTEGKIRKTYIAVTDGVPEAKEGQLVSYMRRAPDSIIKREETTSDDPEGKLALTEYRVLVHNGEHAAVMLSPITGRTHQLRVQLAGIGCPITGDDLYGTSSALINRQALHSALTVLPHPETGETLSLVAPFHNDMSQLLKALFGEGVEEDILGELNVKIQESLKKDI
ncbi:MAG: RluA family pseudouridine synthase [Clostridia bacterium]|nr:RluA family pseudouridine synthase [Clostridia bacterium]